MEPESLTANLSGTHSLFESGEREQDTYAQDGAMRAAFEMFKAFNTQDATDNRRFAATKLSMPVLTIEGDKSMGGVLEIQAKLVASNVRSVVLTDIGHWLMEQRPAEIKTALKSFLMK